MMARHEARGEMRGAATRRRTENGMRMEMEIRLNDGGRAARMEGGGWRVQMFPPFFHGHVSLSVNRCRCLYNTLSHHTHRELP